jgi:hypothetical protein
VTLPGLPDDLWRLALVAGASVGGVGLVVYAAMAAMKHSLHALGYDLGRAGWQVALRWAPIGLGAGLAVLPGVVDLPGAWPALAGAGAGAWSRAIHRVVASRWPDFALTKSARGQDV